MASAGQQGKQLRLARTRARTTLSDIKRSRGLWDQGVKDGRNHLEEACNTITRLWMWPRLCSDTLIRCRSLLTFGTKALRRRYVTALEALRQCYDKLEHQAGLMASALEALKEAVAPVENRALFTCFASRDFSSFLSDIVSPYEAQLQVYKRIVDAFPRASDLFETEHSGWSRAQLKSTGGFEFGMKEPSDFLSAWDQQQASAMVVTWMLQTKLDTQAMESKLQLLSEDMRTV